MRRPCKPSAELPDRKARKRGGKAAKRGRFDEQVPVLEATNRSGTNFSAVLSAVIADALRESLALVLDKDVLLVTDGNTSYPQCAAALWVPVTRRSTSHPENAFVANCKSKRLTTVTPASRVSSEVAGGSPQNILPVICVGIILNSAVGARQSSGKLLMLNQCRCLESSTMAKPIGEAQVNNPPLTNCYYMKTPTKIADIKLLFGCVRLTDVSVASESLAGRKVATTFTPSRAPDTVRCQVKRR